MFNDKVRTFIFTFLIENFLLIIEYLITKLGIANLK